MSTTKTCYYESLGVERTVDGKGLKSAYRKLAMKFHPDQNPDNPDAELKFKQISEAYSVLSDEQKRAAYDRFGHDAFNGQGGGGANQTDFSDIFSQVFGDAFGDMFGARGGGAQNGPGRGSDLRYPLEIELEDAFLGREVNITVPTSKTCDRCHGKGAEPGTDIETCPTCQGAGRIRMRQGLFTMEQTCRTCGGQGQTVKTPCTACDGVGNVATRRSLSVNIPAGVEDGMRIRLAGEGEAGARGGPPGDLYIFVSIRPHDLFERDGADLYCRAPAPMCTAALGGEIDMPTIDGGKKPVKISAGAQTGKRLRLRGEGMPHLRGRGRGDMVIELFVETPRNLSAHQKELLNAFRCECCPESSPGCHPEHEGFFEKARTFWDKMTGENEHP
jgi:molecular chaperone DnaJ